MKSVYEEGGILLVDKPYRWTSFDVVNYVRLFFRNELNIRNIKIGHAGTLDPLATGLLILCTGAFTRKIESMQALEKEYTGTFFMGATTPSFDLEKSIDRTYDTGHLTPAFLEEATRAFTGEIEQVPPVFSAVKIGGKRAYKYARNKVDVEISPKKVNISSFILTEFDLPRVGFRIACSKGTYIRALARDFGVAVNCGAYVESLRRTRIGSFPVEDALDPEALKQLIRTRHFEGNPDASPDNPAILS